MKKYIEHFKTSTKSYHLGLLETLSISINSPRNTCTASSTDYYICIWKCPERHLTVLKELWCIHSKKLYNEKAILEVNMMTWCVHALNYWMQNVVFSWVIEKNFISVKLHIYKLSRAWKISHQNDDYSYSWET